MQILEFFLPMKIPNVTNQMHRIRPAAKKGQRAIVYDSPELADARQKFISYLAGHKPEEPLKGAVQLKVLFCYEPSGKHYHGEFKITKPDTDNLIKLFKDCMTKVGFWKDDAQVASEFVEKRYCNVPGIFVRVVEIVESGRTEEW